MKPIGPHVARWTPEDVSRVVGWLRLPQRSAASLFGVTDATWRTWRRRGCLMDSGAFLFRIADRARSRFPRCSDHVRAMVGAVIGDNGAPENAVMLSEDQRARVWAYLGSLAYSQVELRQVSFLDGGWIDAS